uniref:Uncharacterized protein n=1 Tax=Knipowitschia caucasica TaxID=637954 RepID=A0AAV2KQ36_KNICA
MLESPDADRRWNRKEVSAAVCPSRSQPLKNGITSHELTRMDSPPEYLLSLSHDLPQSPPILPSLDNSPQAQTSPPDSPNALPLHSSEPSPQSPSTTPSFPLSPYALDQDEIHRDCDENEESLDGIPASPTPAVALFPGSGAGQETVHSPILDSSPPATPSAPPLGFGALEIALSSGQKIPDELDLQLFQKDSVATKHSGLAASSASSPALRFPCNPGNTCSNSFAHSCAKPNGSFTSGRDLTCSAGFPM